MSLMNNILSLFRILSLDIVAGACIGTLFIAHYLNIVLSTSIIIVLCICVWSIYTVDHLIDARKIRSHANTRRHRFHQRYFKQLVVINLIAITVGGVLAIGLPLQTLIVGMLLTLLVVAYFIIFNSSKIRIPKEFMGGLIYTVGIFVAPVTAPTYQFDLGIILIFTEFLTIAWMNLVLFSLMEIDVDILDGHQSIARKWGKKRVTSLINYMFLAFIILLLLSLPMSMGQEFLNYQLLLAVMGSTLYLIFLRRNFFKVRERYRIIGDAVFILPLIVL